MKFPSVRILFLSLFSLIASLFVTTLLYPQVRSDITKFVNTFKITDPRDIRFFNAEDKLFSMESIKGHPTIISLWTGWCKTCVEELDRLVELKEKLDHTNVKVYPIFLGPFAFQGLAKMRSKNIKNPSKHLYYDRNGKISRYFSPSILPLTIFLNTRGKEIYRHEGGLDWRGEKMRSLLKKYFNVTLSKKD